MKNKLAYMATRLGSDMMITVTLTHVGENKSDILIGEEPITVDNEDLLEAFDTAEKFLDANVDGG